MSIDSNIQRCGGLDPIYGTAFRTATKLEISSIEKMIGFKIPSKYSSFLEKYGSSTFNSITSFDMDNPNSLYNHKESTGLKNYSIKRGILSYFYGAATNEKDHLKLETAIRIYKSRIPDGFLPIASDGAGNQICISLNTSFFEGIYFWNHENEWDEEDCKDDIGEEMPESAKLQNVYLIASNLESFFSKLKSENI